MQTLLKSTRAYQLLKTEGKQGDFSHAYLLSFEDGSFLRAALKIFAKLFFACDEPTTPAQKRASELIDDENFTDCVLFPAEGKKLVVEDAEKIVEESNLTPVEGERKVFLLGDFSEANAQTQNKLLKLLEEPPKGVIFLLGATSPFAVLPTVLSRTKKLEIFPFSESEIRDFLQRRYEGKYAAEDLALCAATSGGNAGEACKLLEGGRYHGLVEDAFSLLLSPVYKLPIAVKQAGETPYKKELLRVLRLILRDGLVRKTGAGGKLFLSAERARIDEVAKAFTIGGLLNAQEALTEAEKQVHFNAVFPQCIESCMAKIFTENEKIEGYKEKRI